MADDTRKPGAVGEGSDSNARPYQGKIYEVFGGQSPEAPTSSPSASSSSAAAASTAPSSTTAPIRPPENANLLPGGTTNTAGGGRLEDYGFLDAAKTIKLEEYREFHKKPCVRDSLLTGIGAGFGVGGMMGVLGKGIWRASNWAVGSFCFLSFGAYQYCLIRRQIEKDGMKRAVEIMDQKKAERERKMEEARQARRRAKEEAEKAEEAKKAAEGKSWYKFW